MMALFNDVSAAIAESGKGYSKYKININNGDKILIHFEFYCLFICWVSFK